MPRLMYLVPAWWRLLLATTIKLKIVPLNLISVSILDYSHVCRSHGWQQSTTFCTWLPCKTPSTTYDCIGTFRRLPWIRIRQKGGFYISLTFCLGIDRMAELLRPCFGPRCWSDHMCSCNSNFLVYILPVVFCITFHCLLCDPTSSQKAVKFMSTWFRVSCGLN